jgi:hypothetical protein
MLQPCRDMPPSTQDVAGSIQADRQQLRVSELEVLFQVWDRDQSGIYP